MGSAPVIEARPATLANWPHWLGPQSRSSRAMTCRRVGVGVGVEVGVRDRVRFAACGP